ncbi:MAG: GNAT family N-acetyltransferase [Verrucomicrobiota bacterium]
MSLRTVITHDLASLKKDWQRLWARTPHPHLSHEWHTAWHDHLRQGAEAHFVVAMDGDTVVGIAPLVLKTEGAGPKGLIKLRQLTFHGVHFVDEMDFLTDGRPETDRALSQATLEMSGWDVCELRRFQRESTVATTLCSTAAERHLGCQLSGIGVSPYLTITGDFDTYYASIGKEWRTHGERKRRKMEREAGGCRLEIVRQPNRELFHALKKLAQDRRDAGDTRRCPLLEPARFAFLESLLPVFNERGWWRIALLYAGDAITAYQICFELNQTAYLWSLAYHPDFEIYSPGKVLLRLHLEECFKEGMKEFDFMAGDESYKGHWTSAERQQVAVRVTRPVWKNRLANLWKKPA